MHENEEGRLTETLITFYGDTIFTDQWFHLKEEQYRQFLETIYHGQYIKQIMFLHEKRVLPILQTPHWNFIFPTGNQLHFAHDVCVGLHALGGIKK